MPQYKELLSAIKNASRSLNEAAEAATDTISGVEKRLLECEPGVTVWHAVIVDEVTTHEGDDGAPQDARRRVTLGFGKVKGKWGIAVRDEVLGKDQADDAEPLERELGLLRKAERDIRILALPHLPDLLQAILDALHARAARLSPPADEQPASDGPELAQTETELATAEVQLS